MGSENVLVINPVDHSLVLPAICLVLFFFFCIYQLARLIIIILRRKKLYSAAWLIIDGHDRLEKDSRMVTVDGEILTNDFVKKQISKNEEKIEKIRKKHRDTDDTFDKTDEEITGRTSTPAVSNAIKADQQVKAEASETVSADNNASEVKKAKKEKKKAVAVETVLNSIYEEDDLFYDAMHAYYEIRMPEISDETVRIQVLRKSRKKNASNSRKQKQMKEQFEKYSVFD